VIKSWLVRSKERFYNSTATRSDTRTGSKNAPTNAIESENAPTNPSEEIPSTQLKKATTVTTTTIETQIEEQSK